MQIKETRTQYAAIHPRFPVISMAQEWQASATLALASAEELRKIVGRPVRIMSRTTVTVTDYAEVMAIADPPGN